MKLIGDMSTLERNYAVTEFRRNPEIKIFIISLMTGGLGLNLPEATTVIHFDNWWNPARMWQAEDRAHRSGQTKPVTVYSFLMKDTIEERIEQVLKQKEKIIKQMIEQKGQEIEGELNNLISLDEWRDIFDV